METHWIKSGGTFRLLNIFILSLQIGSYFGSEVCVVDVDQDGITDILLIAAPMFLGAGNKETGKVYVYCLDRVRTTVTVLFVWCVCERQR